MYPAPLDPPEIIFAPEWAELVPPMRTFVEVDWQPAVTLPSTTVGINQIRKCETVEDVEGLIEDRIHQELRERVTARIDSSKLRAAAERLFAMKEAVACPVT